MTPTIILLLLCALLFVVSCGIYFHLRRSTARHAPQNLLEIIQRLKATKAQWPAIMTALNPRNDKKIQELIIELRGPHMFAPHTALNLMENACRSLGQGANDSRAVLRTACESMKKVTRFGE